MGKVGAKWNGLLDLRDWVVMRGERMFEVGWKTPRTPSCPDARSNADGVLMDA